MPFKIRARTPKGENLTLDVEDDTPMGLFKFQMEEQTQIPAYELVFLTGFPPRPLQAEDTDLVAAHIQRGDQLIIQQGKADMKQGHTDGKYIPPSRAQGSFAKRVVPGDDSCLFHSCAYVLENRSRSKGPSLRAKIAEVVSSHPQKYTTEFLGQSNASYCAWIQSPKAWGGAIELSILSFVYQTEIVALDVQTTRFDRYGEADGYTTQAFVCYTGKHYDAMAMARYGGQSVETDDQVMFNAKDENVLKKAIAFIKDEHKRAD